MDDGIGGLTGRYLADAGNRPDRDALAFYAMLDAIDASSPSVAAAIRQELRDQRSNLKLIASENYCSLAVQFAQGTLLTDKYAEGYPFHRFYAGCDNVDTIEAECVELAKSVFGAQHAYVQPHSGADANLVAFLSILATRVEHPLLVEMDQENPVALERAQWQRIREATLGQRLMSLDYYSGGHLTHGYRHNISALLFDVYTYTVDRETKRLDLDAIRRQAREVKPFILLAGYSAYPRRINFAKMREIADEVGAVFMVDMAHFAGLVAGKVFADEYDPVRWAHVVTTTTHKTLRGPRGGMVLCTEEFAEQVDKGCPAILGGPLPHVMAAKAVALREASQPSFREYASRIVENAAALAEGCMDEGIEVLTGGSDNHLLLLDVTKSFGITGRQAETALRECGITLNRNALPFDENGPWYTSGLRVGTPAVTTLGMGTQDMKDIAHTIGLVLSAVEPSTTRSGETSKAKYALESGLAASARERTVSLLQRFPVYSQLTLPV
jgi:glycine hydroxymethyltransferase